MSTDTSTKRKLRFPSFSIQILLGLVLGIALGYLALRLGPVDEETENWLTVTLDTIGSSFVGLLRAIVPPLVFTAIVASIANLRKVTNAARLAGQTLLWFAITAGIAVAIGMALGLITRPGENTSIGAEHAEAPGRTGSWVDFLTGLLPSNFLGIEASARGDSVSLGFNVLQIVVISLVIGIAALRSGRKAEPFLSFNASALSIIQKVLWWVIRLAPIGTLGLIGNAVATYGSDLFGPLATYTVAIYAGLVLVLFVVYPLLLRSHGLSILQYFRGAWPAIQLAFVSRSSIGTLPVTERVTERNLGVPRAYASFAVPLGATTKMDGCAAIYPAISAIFVAQFYGIDLQITDYLLIAFVSVVGSAATAGMTGAVVMLTLTLSTLGLPLEGVGLLLAVDPILDMGRTAVNVAGQALVPTIVSKREGILDRERYDAGNAEHLFDEDEADAVDDTDAAADTDAAGDPDEAGDTDAAGDGDAQAASDQNEPAAAR
ncbi:MAG TPA: dicarboxylate/amino acid:cation symporter [Candidatus Ruania gallistercoris]|uniref:Dicarboxylate/amino acid:cation symporter n=1 Tax=Candidatus Ruania gallistercoris TaxID=2838746 RepID=A0A9D2J2N4_9MICO|nr:dicarboxylate/amino acid:cation symporter [Candidatus Ruania gallistercoris]